MPKLRSEAADRLLREAMRLFAEKGYEATTVADIQAAAGLAPGSGALYKHFPSKEAVLRAGIDAFIEEAKRAHLAMGQLPETPAMALRQLAADALSSLRRDRDMLRIVWRDLERFPDLKRRVLEERIQATVKQLEKWLQERAGRGQLRGGDSQARATVLLGSLGFFQLFEALLGERFGAVGEERFIQAWTDLMMRGLALDEERG